IILIVVILNAILGVTQSRKAESSLDSLKKLSAPNAKVIRDGKKVTIQVRELVAGDIVLLEAGDYVPADGRLIEAESLKVVEGMLTGESEPVLKHTERIEDEVVVGDRRNSVFSGATVVYGRGIMAVTATGMNTEVGKVATLLESAGTKQTPLQVKLDSFGKKLGLIIMIIAAIIFGVEVFRGYRAGGNLKDLIFSSFMFAIAVAVAAIPEALSSIVTIVLSVGTKEMAQKQAIIRKLPAVETLGSTSIICTDKTGTLTQNKMTVVDFFMYGVKKEQIDKDTTLESQDGAMNLSSTLCNDSEIAEGGVEIGDPTEVAFLRYAEKRGLDYKEIRDKYDRLNEIPFDSDRKLMSTVNSIGGNAIMFVKGAPDIVLQRSIKALNDGDEVPMTEEILNKYKQINEEFSDRALRVLAFSIKDVPDENFVPAIEDEVDLTFVGLMAMIDPPRKEVFGAVKEAISAGIKTIMITGDHKTTAAAIAKELGIMSKDDKALTGKELDALSEGELSEQLEHITVYARVSPENKIRIVKAWQEKGKVTAMTGDGVNDAPALKQANIGIGMGSGTDVAKDAAAMVLTDDNFATIVNAIEIGRTVYSNIKKSITYLLAGNLAAIIAIVFAVVINWENPFTTLQLLFINLINDSLPAIALAFEVAEPNTMNKPPRDINEGILQGGTSSVILIRGIIISIVVIIAQYLGNKTSPILGAAMAFSTITLSRIFQTLPARSDNISVFNIGVAKNKYVLGAIGICLLLYLIVLLPGLRAIFSIPNYFGVMEFAICILLALISTVLMELVKIFKK
ncbi:MAG: cation-translocating P-type ATPase, partial [Clostridium sp.]